MATFFRGYPTCTCMAEWLEAYEQALLNRGLLKSRLDIYQLTGRAPASAGYHAGGGGADLGQDATEQIRIARQMGAAAWARGRPAFATPHSHLALKGCPHLTAGLRQQIAALENGRDGLRGNGPDPGPRKGVKWPLRTWRSGIAWAHKQSEEEMNQTQSKKLDEIWKSTRTGHKGVHHQGLILAEIAKLAKRLDTIEKKLTK